MCQHWGYRKNKMDQNLSLHSDRESDGSLKREGGWRQEGVYRSYLESLQAPLIWYHIIVSHFTCARSPSLQVKTMQVNSLGLWLLLTTTLPPAPPRHPGQRPRSQRGLKASWSGPQTNNHIISPKIKMIFCLFV